jgi:chemotaxis receptor (MCP) glutamine deamidase CheD
VAVCLWSAETRIGGINHFLVPRSMPGDQNYLGGDRAIPKLVEQLLSHMQSHQQGHSHRHGHRPNAGSPPSRSHQPRSLPTRPAGLSVHPRQLIAKVFGGAHTGQHGWNGGAENILVAWSELRKAGIPIVAADVGGADSRRISFNVATGQVQVIRRSAAVPKEEPK